MSFQVGMNGKNTRNQPNYAQKKSLDKGYE